MEGNETTYIREHTDIEALLIAGPQDRSGRVTIGYVDDDPLLLNTVARTLRLASRSGFPHYRLLLFGDPRLVEPACERGVEFKLLLSDHQMPYKNGIEVLRDVKRRRPETITGLMSGTYDPQTNPQDAELVQFFLSKPVESEQIVRTLLKYVMRENDGCGQRSRSLNP